MDHTVAPPGIGTSNERGVPRDQIRRVRHDGKHHVGRFTEERDAITREAAAPKPGIGTSSERGVSWHRGNKRWSACIQHWSVGKYHIGSFMEERDAVAAVRAAREAAETGRLELTGIH